MVVTMHFRQESEDDRQMLHVSPQDAYKHIFDEQCGSVAAAWKTKSEWQLEGFHRLTTMWQQERE